MKMIDIDDRYWPNEAEATPGDEALDLLERLDEHLDFRGKQLLPGDLGIEDVTPVNALFEKAGELLKHL